MDVSTTTSPSWSHGNNHVGHEEGNHLRPILRRMCRSCSECARKKKSCDGKRPCGRCMRSGDQCTYSERRRYGERARMQRHQPQGPDRNGMKAEDALLDSTTGALVTSGMLPFKSRCRLSASPATGLVGMQENAFLSDFFGCHGFLPLTTPSQIRETMVKIMLPPASFQQPVLGDDCDEGGHYFEVVAPGGDLGTSSARNQLAMGPSACTFWCAVALGALAKGNPIESVTSYAHLAEGALANSRSGPGDAEVAKAWVILANLHGCMGDKERFEKYLALSDSFLRRQGSTDPSLPVGFAEIVKFKDIANVSCGKWQVESFPVQEETVSPPQLNQAATEAELYRYVSQSCAAFEKAIYTTATEQSASGTNSLCDSELHSRPDVVPSSLEDFMAADISKAMRALLEDGGFVDCGPLQEVVDRRPSIRRGIGVLFINGPYIMRTAGKGDLHATRESIGRCIEVLERYPGLCRCMIGYHMAHMLLICLAAAGGSNDQAMYARIRVILNSFRAPGSRPVPPFVEWRGVGAFCDEIFCRSIEGLVPCGHMGPFLEPPVDDIDTDFGTTATGSSIDEDAPHGHGFTQREILPALNSIPGKTIGTAPVWPTDSGVEGDIGPTLVPTAPPTTSPTSSNRAFCQSEAGLHSVGVARRVTTPEPSVSGLPESSERDGKPEDTGEDGIAEEDWLDVAHAISDAAEAV
ncbi:unnamed protein product [Ectocarpus sp. 12 AP-2014]